MFLLEIILADEHRHNLYSECTALQCCLAGVCVCGVYIYVYIYIHTRTPLCPAELLQCSLMESHAGQQPTASKDSRGGCSLCLQLQGRSRNRPGAVAVAGADLFQVFGLGRESNCRVSICWTASGLLLVLVSCCILDMKLSPVAV